MSPPDELADRVAALEARVAALEGPAAAVPEPPADDGSGELGYDGAVRLAGAVAWRIRYGAAAVLELPDAPVVEVLAALGHPVRLAVVRRLLAGPATAAQLREAAALTSTGQVYHHLRTLSGARLVEQDARRYRLPATGVVPVLVAVLAAADLAGALP